jgi:hypothetical protein
VRGRPNLERQRGQARAASQMSAAIAGDLRMQPVPANCRRLVASLRRPPSPGARSSCAPGWPPPRRFQKGHLGVREDDVVLQSVTPPECRGLRAVPISLNPGLSGICRGTVVLSSQPGKRGLDRKCLLDDAGAVGDHAHKRRCRIRATRGGDPHGTGRSLPWGPAPFHYPNSIPGEISARLGRGTTQTWL